MSNANVMNVVVEAIVDPRCPIDFSVLKLQLGEFLKHSNPFHSVFESTSTRIATTPRLDLTSASELLQNSILQCDIVEYDYVGLSASSQDDESFNSRPSSNDEIQSNNHYSEFHYEVTLHLYVLNEDPPEPEEIHDPAAQGDGDPITVCDTIMVPHISLHTSWENLIFPKSLKRNLLSYANTALLFAHKNVSPHVVNWNRVLMLYGPPGTGKTTLCRALAHKLSIQMRHIYTSGGYLLEIKSHSLFSKWFSESGKLIARLFDRIRELVQDEPDALFCVLIDEVESLAGSRTASQNGSEPSDAIRAVNSLLTSLDSIRQFRNVLILTTTNLTDCIDSAFVDRVDWMVKVDLPNVHARYEILRGCIMELESKGILLCELGEESKQNFEGNSLSSTSPFGMEDYHNALLMEEMNMSKSTSATMTNFVPELILLECARTAEGFSGRSLRKLPFQTFAFHTGPSRLSVINNSSTLSITDFLPALKKSITKKMKNDF